MPSYAPAGRADATAVRCDAGVAATVRRRLASEEFLPAEDFSSVGCDIRHGHSRQRFRRPDISGTGPLPGKSWRNDREPPVGTSARQGVERWNYRPAVATVPNQTQAARTAAIIAVSGSSPISGRSWSPQSTRIFQLAHVEPGGLSVAHGAAEPSRSASARRECAVTALNVMPWLSNQSVHQFAAAPGAAIVRFASLPRIWLRVAVFTA